MGQFWDRIELEIQRGNDPRWAAPSKRQIALALNVAPQTLTNWKRGLKSLPTRKNLEAVARFTNDTYENVLLLALSETGHAEGTRLARQFSSPQPLAMGQSLPSPGSRSDSRNGPRLLVEDQRE